MVAAEERAVCGGTSERRKGEEEREREKKKYISTDGRFIAKYIPLMVYRKRERREWEG